MNMVYGMPTRQVPDVIRTQYAPHRRRAPGDFETKLHDSGAFAYLAGPVSGLDLEVSTGWYNKIADLMPGIHCICPMRGSILQDETWERLQGHPNAITQRCLNDIIRSDVVIMNGLPGEQEPMLGCMIELGFAFAMKVPIVFIATPQSRFRIHPMISHMVMTFTGNEAEAAHVVNTMFKVR